MIVYDAGSFMMLMTTHGYADCFEYRADYSTASCGTVDWMYGPIEPAVPLPAYYNVFAHSVGAVCLGLMLCDNCVAYVTVCSTSYGVTDYT